MRAVDFDAIVAGGGMAGAAAATALSRLGWRVLVVEPGVDYSRRLAGELIHPPGATDLEALGLLRPLQDAGGLPVFGFAVFPEAVPAPASRRAPSVVSAATGAYVLPYDDVPGLRSEGLSLEHAPMMEALMRAIDSRPGCTIWRGARVTGIDPRVPGGVGAIVSEGTREHRLAARLLVAADGRASRLRQLAGIGARKTRISAMVGYRIGGVDLPHPGYGHVFVGGIAPALAYQVGPGQIRVMFDVPENPDGIAALARNPAYLAALPEPLRGAVRRAVRTDEPLVAANFTIVPERVVAGRVVLVGDAGGCCHPLTATGISVCTRDAIRLGEALARCDGDVPAALARYARLRAGPQRTRITLAEALYDAFSARSPEMRLVRDGILRYWERSRRARSASMALLSTHEGRMSVMARQYVRVVGYALPELIRWQSRAGGLAERARTALGLARAVGRIARAALREIDGRGPLLSPP